MTQLLPCPFCGKHLEEVRRPRNPYARCITPDCMGGKLPLISLDLPEDVERWNTRAQPDARLKAEWQAEVLEKVHDKLAPQLVWNVDKQIARHVIRSIKTPGRQAEEG